ncbi:hypothetical protein THAOC_02609, partial [Thalassiosira oceanica]
INPRGSALQVPSFDEDDGADQEQAPPSSSPSEWLESRLVPPGRPPRRRGGSHEVLLVGAPVGLVRGDPHVVRDTQAGVRDGPGRGAPRGDHVRADAQEAGAAAHEAAAEDREGGEREEARPGPHGRGVVRRGRGDELGRRPLRPARPRPRADLLHRAADHRAAPPPQRRRGGHRDRRRGAALGGHRGAVVVERRADALGEEGRRLRRGDHGEGDQDVRVGLEQEGTVRDRGGEVRDCSRADAGHRGEEGGGGREQGKQDHRAGGSECSLREAGAGEAAHVFTWGSTSMGRCGHTSVETGRSSDRRFVQQPRHVSALRNVVVEAVAAGAGHTMALSRGGRVFAWGAGGDGQCGQGHAGNLFSPRPVEGLPSASNPTTVTRKRSSAGGDGNANSNISDVSGKVALEVTLEEESLVKQLSQGARITQTIDEDLPTRSDRIVAIRASGCYSAALSADGDVYTWGYAGGVAVGHEVPPPSDLPLIPLIEGNQYSTSTAAKVYPAGASAENKARDAKCFDTSLNVMLPRRVEATDALGLRVEEVALGPGHMVLLCSRRCDAAGPPGGRGSTLDPDDCDDDGGCNEAGIEVGHFSDTAQTETATDSTFEDTASLTGGAAAQVPPPPSGGTDGSITRSYSLANSTGTGSTNDSPDELTYSQASSVAEPQPSATRSGGGNAGEKKRRTTKGAAGGLLSKLKSTGSSRRRLSFGSGGEVATGNGGGGEGGGGGKRKSSSAIGKMMGMAKRDVSPQPHMSPVSSVTKTSCISLGEVRHLYAVAVGWLSVDAAAAAT